MSNIVKLISGGMKSSQHVAHVPRFRQSNTLPNLAIISGSTSQVGPKLADTLNQRGYSVVCLHSRDEAPNTIKRYLPIQLNRNMMHQKEHVIEQLKPVFSRLGRINRVAVINLVGTPTGNLDRVNVEVPKAAIEAVEQLAKGANRFAIGHISSMAATINGSDCPYAESKRKIDLYIQEHSNSDAAIALRPGIIMPKPEGYILNMGHRYSPNEISNLFFNLFVGSGNQIMQPVAEDCLIEALVRGIEGSNHSIIDAVGKDVITQKEFIDFFRKFSKKTALMNISIPYPLASAVAKHLSTGRMQEYAVNLLRILDQTPRVLSAEKFVTLLGREPYGLKDLYNDNSNIKFPMPGLASHASEALNKAITNKSFRSDLVKAFYKS